jgi:adenylate cyclase class 2
MGIETEIKLRVESLEGLEDRLTELGAAFVAEQVQTDCYFDDGSRTLTGSDRCLRLRRLRVGNTDRNLLTYKGAKEEHELKRRQEIEIEVEDRNSAVELLCALGYEEVLTFEKKRRVWRLCECEVALDELPLLGSFVEIEGPNTDKIKEVQGSLGLEQLGHVPDSYASLVAERLRQRSYKQEKP